MSDHVQDPLPCVDRRVSSIWQVYDNSTSMNIGSGAFGKIFVASLKSTQDRHALKIIPKVPVEGLKVSSHRISRLFSNEVGLLSSIQHSGVVNFISAIEDDDNYIIAMEHLEGGPLFDRIIELDHYSELVAAKLVFQILSVLVHLHEHNICHLDLKPENFVLARPGDDQSLKLIDFGLSLRVDEEKDTYPACGTGTYKSPEMRDVHGFRRTPLMLRRADSYSLGVVLFAMLCGEFPEFNEEKQILFPVHVSISSEAKNLIRGLTAFSFLYRTSVEKAFQHPWVRGTAPDVPLLRSQVFAGLRNFRFMTLFQSHMVRLLADNLSTQDRSKMQKAFQAIDDDNDGALSIVDLTRLFMQNKKKLGLIDERQAVARAHSLFLKRDLDEDGKLSPSDLEEIQILGGILAPDGDFAADLTGLFNLIDIDGDGAVTMNELGTFLAHNSEEELALMFKEADGDGDGLLGLDDFITAVRGGMARTHSLRSRTSRRSIASHLLNFVASRSSFSTLGSPTSLRSPDQFD